ncbi:hypothetical protein [Pseudochryseolinea flava]|uniref:Uncharacterized protein n=1 Tax=Pseudochryseolinea flava TaxID=2059302 RepID=A0A364Y557_9BACT|nr:hypothetical protein [Pseudochryseolinea flava]RAW01318.1 hypothetical protein DQQ10_10450 [Pseudochryseolinea flava]
MKFIAQIILIAILAYLLDLFLPWYSIAIAAFAVSVFFQSRSNFFAGFLGVGILWFAAVWMINGSSSSGLAARVAGILTVNSDVVLMLVTALIGALVAGCAAVAGASLRKEKRRY